MNALTKQLPQLDTACLTDRFGRQHRALRISVTDVCNIRCQYCMPADDVQFLESEQLLSFDEITRFAHIAAESGIRKLRITGGEPLMRRNLPELIAGLAQIDLLDELALTTNGMLLAEHIQPLARAGLTRINISLDTLSAETFRRLARRDGLQRVLAGIDAAVACPGVKVKLNALILREVNLGDVVDLVRFSADRDLELRFIEFMPLDAERKWTDSQVVSGQELRALIEREIGPLRPLRRERPSQPAADYEFTHGGPGRLGFIDSVTNPFCSACDRIRLTADGKLRNCLFGQEEWNVAPLLRDPQVDRQALVREMQACVLAKHAAHGIAQPDFQPPQRAMYQIGG